jgi:3-dehydroquinate dehydratase
MPPRSPGLVPPLLVGVVDRPEGLARLAEAAPEARRVDLVEARVDRFDPPLRAVAGWRSACARLEASGTPVLVTVRLGAEGGDWTGPDAERMPIFREAVAVASWLDVEGQSPMAGDIIALGHAHERTVVV